MSSFIEPVSPLRSGLVWLLFLAFLTPPFVVWRMSLQFGATHIVMIILVVVLWAIWEARNASKHEDQSFHPSKILNRVCYTIMYLSKTCHMNQKHWRRAMLTTSYFHVHLSPKVQRPPTLVRWIKPPDGSLKLNVDASFGGAGGDGGGGGVLRDDQGSFIVAFSLVLQVSSPLEAEVVAMSRVLQWCYENNITGMQVESDSAVFISHVQAE